MLKNKILDKELQQLLTCGIKKDIMFKTELIIRKNLVKMLS